MAELQAPEEIVREVRGSKEQAAAVVACLDRYLKDPDLREEKREFYVHKKEVLEAWLAKQ